jgi:putative tricarboxylic transport membrane protein
MFDYLSAAVLASLLGFVVGLMPGLSATSILIVIYGFMMGHDLMTLLIFYACLITATQYSGGISALYLGVPGETNSLPMVALRSKIIADDSVGRVIVLTSIGSFIVALTTLVVGLLGIQWLNQYSSYLQSWVMVVMGVVGISLSVIFSGNQCLKSLLLIVVGWLLSRIGTDPVEMSDFLTFGNDYLRGGLPTIAVLLGLFAVPCFFSARDQSIGPISAHSGRLRFDLHDALTHLPVILRSGTVGFLAGLVPYIGVSVSSNLAYFLQKWLNKQDAVRQAVAAESANNAAAIAVLVPFVAFGIAIQASEGIMLDVMAQNGLVLALHHVDIMMLSAMLILCNVICMGLAWPLSGKIATLYKNHVNLIMIGVVILCVCTVIHMGSQLQQGIYYMICLLVLGVAGYMLRRLDTLPLIFAFLLQPSLEPALLRTVDILVFAVQ